MDGWSFRRSATTCPAGITRKYPGSRVIFSIIPRLSSISSLWDRVTCALVWLELSPRFLDATAAAAAARLKLFCQKKRHGWYSFTFKFPVDFDVAMQAVLGSSSHVNLLTFQEETPVFAISLSTHSTRSTPLSLSLFGVRSLELSSSASGDAASLPELWRIPHLHPSFSIFTA